MQENEINNAKKELANLYMILKLGESYDVNELYLIFKYLLY